MERPMPQLVEPPLADHLVDEEGLVYTRDLVIRDETLPARFSASLLAEGPDGPPWNTVVTGLETDRLDMRSRFEIALSSANGRQRARLATALSACYSGAFGFRRDGEGRADFETWLEGLPIKRERGRHAPDQRSKEDAMRFERHGCRLISLNPATGHVPVGHDLLLSILAEADPALREARFDELADFEPDDPAEDDVPSPYELRAWLGSRRYEADAYAYGDIADSISSIGFLNAILRSLGTVARFRLLGSDGELAAHGRPASLADL
jgi:hypothetical protein